MYDNNMVTINHFCNNLFSKKLSEKGMHGNLGSEIFIFNYLIKKNKLFI